MLGIVGLGAFSGGPSRDLLEEELVRQLQDHPDVQREVGDIESLTTNISRTVEVSDEFEPDANIWAFDIKGSQGDAELIIEDRFSVDQWILLQRILRTPNGEFDLGPSQTPRDNGLESTPSVSSPEESETVIDSEEGDGT